MNHIEEAYRLGAELAALSMEKEAGALSRARNLYDRFGMRVGSNPTVSRFLDPARRYLDAASGKAHLGYGPTVATLGAHATVDAINPILRRFGAKTDVAPGTAGLADKGANAAEVISGIFG